MLDKIERIILVRHGYSMGNFDANNYKKYGDSEVPLHDTGWKQAIRVGEFFREIFI